MAALPDPGLRFQPGCGDCGSREITLPEPLPALGDDFDWLLRDYDGFRLFMLEELAARFAERRRWTPADLEVVIVEALSVALDQLSDSLDRVAGEAFLETARQPQSVRRLLAMIGYDAVALAEDRAGIPDASAVAGETEQRMRLRLSGFLPALQRYPPVYTSALDELTPTQRLGVQGFLADPATAAATDLSAVQRLLDQAPELVQRARLDALHSYWLQQPAAMDAARRAGPRAIHGQKRMVTAQDYALRMQEHPLVLRAQADSRWSGSWQTLRVAVMLPYNIALDQAITATAVGGGDALAALTTAVDAFNRGHQLEAPAWGGDTDPRRILRPYLDAYRMAGQEVVLQDARLVGIDLSLSLRVAGNYFQSELRRAVLNALGSGLNGFFAPGLRAFGTDLHAGDIIETVAALAGVDSLCLNRFKRVGSRYPDQARSTAGRVRLQGLEVAVCDNDLQRPQRGLIRLVLHGGRRG